MQVLFEQRRSSEATMLKQVGRPFKTGQSGNPRGRPAGARNISTKMRDALRKYGKANDFDAERELLDGIVRDAIAGDSRARELVVGRLLPALKPERQPIKIGVGDNPTLTEVARAILTGVARGNIPSDHASELLSALAAAGRVEELDELRSRVEDLERHAAQGPLNR